MRGSTPRALPDITGQSLYRERRGHPLVAGTGCRRDPRRNALGSLGGSTASRGFRPLRSGVRAVRRRHGEGASCRRATQARRGAGPQHGHRRTAVASRRLTLRPRSRPNARVLPGERLTAMARRSTAALVAVGLLVALLVVAARFPVPYVRLWPGQTVNVLGNQGGKPIIQ